jgi:shikimate dehydrogenase
MNQITGATRVYAILADPIHHVKTPQGINSLFQQAGVDAVMVPVHVAPTGLRKFIEGLREMQNFDGCVVTVPHKTAVISLCDALTPEAKHIGAANVLHRTAEGKLIGGMLDGEGFVAGLRSQGHEPKGLSVYLAGAGGAASAIAFALARAGVAKLTISNRSATKVEQLANRLQPLYPQLPVFIGSDDPRGHDLVVNATSLGLKDTDPLPLNTKLLQSTQLVAEIIMQPVQTALLSAALEKGCPIHYGAPMLSAQIGLMAAFMRGDRNMVGDVG